MMKSDIKKLKCMNRFVFIIPFRNVKDYINECANSLINQKNKNWITIFCDDASTDGSTDSLQVIVDLV
jgi:glycosyltransferase involved in cell wall biosynthesis